MSAAERAPALSRRRARQLGFTFLEMCMVMAVLAIIALVVERTITATVTAEHQVDAGRRATERSEKIDYEILSEVDRSRRLFGGDDVGAAYLSALDLTRDPLRPGSRLPVFEEERPLGPDLAGDPRTGNVLLFARESDPADTVVDPAAHKVRYVDLYRFVCAYPRVTDRVLVAKPPLRKAVDLVLWRSRRYANHAQLMAIADPTERARAVSDLVTRFGCDVAWDPSAGADTAFYDMDASGTLSSTPIPSPTIAEDEDVSDRGRLVYADCQLAPTNASDPVRKALLSVDDPATWQPDGFEVKLVGASGARKVWLHLVVESPGGERTLGVYASTVTASAKDL
jgi:prepilin-type N-terminal cleavage/methylation domain-containing protein